MVFAPHTYHKLWNTGLIWLHAGSDILIALACFSVPLGVLYIRRRRTDIAMGFMLGLFAAFILACGVAHAIDVWSMWNVNPWLSGTTKALSAVLAVAAAAMLWRSIPGIVAQPGRDRLINNAPERRQGDVRGGEVRCAPPEYETQLRRAFDLAPVGKALVDVDGHWLKVNTALCVIVGYSPSELMARTCRAITHPDDLDKDIPQLQRLLAGEIDTYRVEKRYVHKQGHIVWALLSVTLVRAGDGTPQYFIMQVLDISERKRMENDLRDIQVELEARVEARTRELAVVNRRLQESNRRLKILAGTDSLTGLHNRWALMETLEKQVSESLRYASSWCLMLIDIDHFKKINDNYGHLIGDRALEAFGRAIRDHTRDSDFSARYGGDEFCFLAPHTDIAQACRLAEKLRETLASVALHDRSGNRVKLTCSIGIVQWHASLDTVARVIDAVDSELYRAKQTGRDRVMGVDRQRVV
jgi:diguanylate cyclase (GGDEF)-like protein/PAS domain S-box-containing protein